MSLKLAGADPILIQAGPVQREFIWRGIKVREYSNRQDSSTAPARRGLLARVAAGRVDSAAVQAMAQDIESASPSERLDGVLFYNQDLIYALQIGNACRKTRVPFVQQYAEIHLPDDYANGWRSTYWLSERAHLHIIPHFSDGAVVISKALTEWVRTRSSHSSMIVPTVSEVPPAAPRFPHSDLQVLCVSSGGRRDSLPMLMEAISAARASGSRVRLCIVGLGKTALGPMAQMRTQLGLDSAVEIKGFVTDEEFEQIVAASDVNVLVRTDDVSSRSCFPSRLHELFSSGVPVVLSDVGDINLYFRHKVDCLLVEPGSVASLTEQFLWIDKNRDAAAAIGLAGNETARKAFDPTARGRELLEFFQRIVDGTSE